MQAPIATYHLALQSIGMRLAEFSAFFVGECFPRSAKKAIVRVLFPVYRFIQWCFPSQNKRLDRMLDAFLGIRFLEVRKALLSSPHSYSGEMVALECFSGNLQTRYHQIWNIFHSLKPSAGSTFVDLGSGLGRPLLFLGMFFPKTRGVGYELVHERVQEANRVAQKIDLSHIRFEKKNVMDSSFQLRRADYYLLFNSFRKRTLEKVFQDLQKMSYTKSFRLVLYGRRPRELAELAQWLCFEFACDKEVFVFRTTGRSDRKSPDRVKASIECGIDVRHPE